MGLNTFLGTTLDLKAPYLNAIKYDYQVLPFFCFLAASMMTKSLSLIASAKTKPKLNKLFSYLIAVGGLVLIVGTSLYNMRFVNLFSGWNYLLFRVEPNVNFGYSIFNSVPLGSDSVLMGLQFLGFAVALSGLVWVSRRRISFLLKLSRQTPEKK